MELFDLAILFGDDLVGAGHDLLDLQAAVRRFGVMLIVGLQFRQKAAFLSFPIPAAVGEQGRRRTPPRRSRLDLQQLPLKLGVTGLHVADFVHCQQIAAGSILGHLGPIAVHRPGQELRPQTFIGRLQGKDLGLQRLDLAGEVRSNLPPTIALGLQELPHAGVLGLQGAGEMGGPGVGRLGRRTGCGQFVLRDSGRG